MASSPTVARMEFSLIVRERRHELKLSAETVAKQLGLSRVYYSSIENSRALPSEEKLDAFINVLQLEGADAEELRDLSRRARERAWWHDYQRVIPNPTFAEFVGLEFGASRLRIHETRLMTGLFQTADYINAVSTADPAHSLVEARDALEVRIKRQQVLNGLERPDVELVVSEAVLMQHWGPPSVLLGQLDAILARIDRDADRFDFRIQPFSVVPLGFASTSTTVILDFAASRLGSVAYEEGRRGDLHFEEEVVSSLVTHFEQAQLSALGPEQSEAKLRSRIDFLRSA